MTNVALITGASNGIGKELAYIHAQNKGDLILIARSSNQLEEIKQDIESKYKNNVYLIVKDLTEKDAANFIYNEIKNKKFKIDILINNAGFGGIGKFHERNLNEELNMVQLNIIALISLTRLFLPDMIKAQKGKILNISSTASLLPGPLQAVYYATKAFVTSFSNALAEELSDTNITVSNLMPGATKTNFGKVSGMDKTSLFNKPANAYDVALSGYNGMLKGKLNIISGISLGQRLSFIILPFVPKRFLLKQVRQLQEIKK